MEVGRKPQTYLRISIYKKRLQQHCLKDLIYLLFASTKKHQLLLTASKAEFAEEHTNASTQDWKYAINEM